MANKIISSTGYEVEIDNIAKVDTLNVSLAAKADKATTYTKIESDALLFEKTVTIGTLADLRAETTISSTVYVTGYHTAGDGAFGSNIFYWDETSVEDDNGGTIIKLTSITTGRYKLKFSEAVNVKWFGAKGDGVTDDLLAINSAIRLEALNTIRSEYASSHSVYLPNTNNFYRVSDTIYVNRTVKIYSDTPPMLKNGYTTMIKGDAGLNAIIVFLQAGGASAPDEYETTDIGLDYGAVRSQMINVSVQPINKYMVKYGVVHNTVVFFENVTSSYFSSYGFFAKAGTGGPISNMFLESTYDAVTNLYGNTNSSRYFNCIGYFNSKHGFVSSGTNSGTITYEKCDASQNKGAGFVDDTSIGCEYIACHTAQNVFKVEHNGVIYMCIKAHTSTSISEPGLGSDWKTYWALPTATTFDAQWNINTYFIPSGGINSIEDAYSNIAFCYSEGGIEKGIVVRGRCNVFGGISGTRAFYHPEFKTAQVFAGTNKISPLNFVGNLSIYDDSTKYGMSIGDSQHGGIISSFGDYRDNNLKPNSNYKTYWDPSKQSYVLYCENAGRVVYEITSKDSTYGGIGGAAFVVNGIHIADGSSSRTKRFRIRATYNFSTITDNTYGLAIQGDQWHYTAPQPGGYIGAVCTKGGTIGATAIIKEFGLIST